MKTILILMALLLPVSAQAQIRNIWIQQPQGMTTGQIIDSPGGYSTTFLRGPNGERTTITEVPGSISVLQTPGVQPEVDSRSIKEILQEPPIKYSSSGD